MKSKFVDGIEYRFFNHLFAVSRTGKVLRKKSRKRIKLTPYQPVIRGDGYFAVSRYLLHRMVASCWLRLVPGAKLVHHRDHDKSNNSANNLEWVTQKIHMAEKHKGMGIGKHHWTKSMRKKLSSSRTGMKDSQETRAKKRKILLRVSKRKRACIINGVRYRSFLAASKALGIYMHTIRWRCLSKNFPDYQLVKVKR